MVESEGKRIARVRALRVVNGNDRSPSKIEIESIATEGLRKHMLNDDR